MFAQHLGISQVHPFSDEHESDQDEETQSQHLNGRVFLDEFTDWIGKNQHDDDR